MATQTTYYEFNKPAGSDLVNPLTDTNPNWDIADSAMHELNERSFANATETVVLGVHAISRINQYTKFIKWIATANFTAGETFTVDGNVVAASTPAGAALATGAYATGSVVIACLNADDSAMTIFVSGTNVATDSERLGGELPAYYATQSDMSSAQTDIGNIKALDGNTSIVGVGDGTLTGAVSTLNTNLTANSQAFRYGYQNGEYGYITESGGADTFHPFNSAQVFYDRKTGSYPKQSNLIASDITVKKSGTAYCFISGKTSWGMSYINDTKLKVNGSLVNPTANYNDNNQAAGQTFVVSVNAGDTINIFNNSNYDINSIDISYLIAIA